ncbi:MAG: leucine-rich repeat domain-containing protein [Clostridia bacterium]|nr:leucine-rich repeat domain-containing protein [Clostridia bacterium]
MEERGYVIYRDGSRAYIEEGITVLGELSCDKGKDYLRENVIEIFVPKSVLMIMEGAFCDFTALEKLRIAKDSMLRCIGNEAFFRCGRLKTVEFENAENLQWIGYCAFAFTGLEYTNMSDLNSLEGIGRGIFKGCVHLQAVKLPGGLSIPDDCFKGCKNLLKVETEDISYIGADAFEGCSSLVKIEIHDEYMYGGVDGDDYHKVYYRSGNEEFISCMTEKKYIKIIKL